MLEIESKHEMPTSRSVFRLIDFWLIVAGGILLGALIERSHENIVGRLTWVAVFLLAVGYGWRVSKVRSFFEALLGARSFDDRRQKVALALETWSMAAAEMESREIIQFPTKKLSAGERVAWRWLLVGFALVGFLLLVLERSQPYFFVQDDNLSQFMPVILHGCRSLFNDGVFSTWNAHQFMGSPTASLGTYALTYPFTYLAYGFARYLVHDEFATLDVFCVGHLLVGYLAMFWACRCAGIRPILAAAGGVSFAFSGYFLIAGKSWYYMTPLAVYAPLMFGLFEKFRRASFGWALVLPSALVFGLLFHSGNAQMWCYAGMFFIVGVGVLLVCKAIAWSQAIPALCSVAIGVAIALPLLVPQFLETAKLPAPRTITP